MDNSHDFEYVDDSQLALQVLVKKFLFGFAVILCGYVLGWFGLSFAWILIGLFFWLLRHKNMLENRLNVRMHRALAQDEKETISTTLKSLPSWVYFPDSERAEWCNKILKQMWPFIGEYAKRLIKESIEPSISSCLPDYLKSFHFEKIDLGTFPIRIGSVKCYDENTSREEIILDLELIYAGNCDIQVRIKGIRAGIRDFCLSGVLRVEMRPLLKDMPLVGGVSCYFLNNPNIEFNLTNMADVLDLPGLGDFLRRAIREQLAALMVLPNKYVLPLVEDLSMKTIKFVPPIGIIRIELIDAKNLRKADVGMLGMGKSDPYCIISVGNQEFTTTVIQNTINPKWHYVCEALVHHLHGQTIDFEVMDEDKGSKDDFLGKLSIPLTTVHDEGFIDLTTKLKDTKTGDIHLRLQWFALSTSLYDMNAQILESKQFLGKINNQAPRASLTGANSIGSIVALLVYLDSAKNLSPAGKIAMEPSPYVVMTVGQNGQMKQSSVRCVTANPVWEESFYFLIGEPNQESPLFIEVMDSKLNKSLGTVIIKLVDILEAENMTLDQPHHIQGKGSGCEVLLTAQMRILKAKSRIPKIIMQSSENISENNNNTIPSLEEMVNATIEPFAKTMGSKDSILEKAQKSRTNSLRRRGSTSQSSTVLENHYPQMEVTLQRPSSNKVVMTIHRAINLSKVGNQPPSPFVRISRAGERGNKRKTDVCSKTCDPIYEETFEFDAIKEDEKRVELVVDTKVPSSNIFSKRHKILGIAKIDFSDLGQSQQITQWYDLEMIDD